MNPRYKKSVEWLNKAERLIPLASQTFSKSKLNFPPGASPLFLERGKGSRVYDVDGNDYVDFASALLCISLGYQDPDVDEAVREQMKSGVSFSLPHRLEYEVAERLVDLIPCAEMVRFGKNGTDATSAAIRLARAVTARDHVAVCGYHGWQDWYIGSTPRDLGVPEAVKNLTHSFSFNDLPSLERVFQACPGSVAAVIVEPMNLSWPSAGFLEGVRELCTRHGTVLIFDEIITGFRFHIGGAQSLFGVTPDLAALGKGMANGYPLAAVVGKRELMRAMEDIFFSGTFGGETLSLAAARATIDKMRREPVLQTIHENGDRLAAGLKDILSSLGSPGFLAVVGHPSWTHLTVGLGAQHDEWCLKSFILQEMFKKGILCLGQHNLSYAHDQLDVRRILDAYRDILPRLIDADQSGSVSTLLDAGVVQPVFKVRA